MRRGRHEIKKKRGPLKWLILFTLIGGLFLFRQALLEKGVHLALSSLFKTDTFHYDQVEWREGKILISGLHVQSKNGDLSVDRIEIGCQLFLWDCYVEPHLLLHHPEIILAQGEGFSPEMNLMVGLIPAKFYAVKCDIDEGVLLLDEVQRRECFYFAFKSGKEKEKIGTLSLYQTWTDIAQNPSETALVHIDIEMKEEQLVTEWRIEQTDMASFFELISFFYPQIEKGWDHLQGEIHLCAQGTFALPFSSSQLSCSQLSCQLGIEDLSVSNQLLGIHARAEHFRGEFNYPSYSLKEGEEGALYPLWRQVMASLSMEGGDFLLDEPLTSQAWGMQGVQAELLLDPNRDPVLDIQGMLVSQDKTYPLSLQGKGSAEEDRSFWLELDLKMQERMEAFLSLCSGEDGLYVFQADIKNLSKEQMDIVGPNPLIAEGIMGGKITAWMRQNQFYQFQIENFSAQDLKWHWPEKQIEGEFSTVSGEGFFVKNEDKWQIQALHAEWGEASFYVFKMREGSVYATEEGDLNGEFVLDSGQKVEFGLDQAVQGWFRSEQWNEQVYGSFFKGLKGDFDLFGVFDQKKIQVSLQGTSVCFHDPFLEFKVEAIGKKDSLLLNTEEWASLEYDLGKKSWRGFLPIRGGTCLLKESGLLFENIEGDMELFKGCAKGKVHNVSLSLNSKAAIQHLCCEVNADFTLSSFLLNKIQGEIQTTEEAYALKAEHVSFQGGAHQAAQFDVSLLDQDRDDQDREILHLVGKIQKERPQEFTVYLDEAASQFLGMKLQISELVLQEDFSLHLLKMKPILKTEATLPLAEFLSRMGLLSLDSQLLKAIEEIKGGDYLQTQLQYEAAKDKLSFQVEGKIESDVFALKGEKSGQKWDVERVKWGDLSGKAVWTVQGEEISFSLFDLETEAFSLKGDGTYRIGAKRFVGQFQSAVRDRKVWKGELLAQGQVAVDGQLAAWQATGELGLVLHDPSSLKVVTKRGIPFTFSLQNGLVVSPAELSLSFGNILTLQTGCHFEELRYDFKTKQGIISGLHFSLPKEALLSWIKREDNMRLPSHLLGESHLAFGPDSIEVQGRIRDGSYHFYGRNWELTQIGFRYRPGFLTLSCQTVFQGLPLRLGMGLDFSSDLAAVLKIQSEGGEPGLKWTFKSTPEEGFLCEKIEGACSGIEAHFLRQASTLSGSVKIDVSQASRLLSREIQQRIAPLQMGKGYELQGRLILPKTGEESFQFQGMLKGENFVFMGNQLEALQAQVEIHPQRAVIKNLKVEDALAKMTIKQMKFARKGAWEFDIPLIQVQDFQPSLLRKIEGGERPVKPFIISHLSLMDCRGHLEDISTFRGKGMLHFTNTFKKNLSFFDIPLELIKNLGLDPGLLTPVSGEVEMQLHGDKFYLTELKNTFSEGKRSQFYLSQEQNPSYFDLNGNLHIDLKIKQAVLLKVIEAFTLTIRGTMEKPKYSLLK